MDNTSFQLNDNDIDDLVQFAENNVNHPNDETEQREGVDLLQTKQYQEIPNKTKPQAEKEDFSWVPLSQEWAKKLRSTNFYVKDCIGDGNCQFRSIQTALTDAGIKTDHIKLRRAIARYINKLSNEEFMNILQQYRIEKENNEFDGGWDPFAVKTRKDFIKHLSTPGFHFEGDNITLMLLSKAINVDFIIFDNTFNITDLSDPDAPHDNVVILYYIRGKSGGHYKTIGLKTTKMHTLFKRRNLPSEIDLIMDKHSFLLNHVKDIYNNHVGTDITLNKVIRAVESRLQYKLGKEEKSRIMIILRNLLESDMFFRTSHQRTKLRSPEQKLLKRTDSKSRTRMVSSSKSPKKRAGTHKTQSKPRTRSPRHKSSTKSSSSKPKSTKKSPKKAKSPKHKSPKRKSSKRKSSSKSPKNRAGTRKSGSKSRTRSSKRKSPKRKSSKRKSSKRKSPKRKSSKRNSSSKSPSRRAGARKSGSKSRTRSSKRKSSKRNSSSKSPKRKSPKRKSHAGTRKTPSKTRTRSLKRKSPKRKIPSRRSGARKTPSKTSRK